MKVLHLIDSGGLYGAERVLLHLAKEQMASGYQVTIVSYGESGAAGKDIELAAESHGIPCEVWRGNPMRRLKKLMVMEKEKAIFHSHGYKFNILLMLLKPYKGGNLLVSTAHGYTSAPLFSKLRLYYLANKFALRALNGVAFVSSQTALQSGGRLNGRERLVIDNGIPEEAQPNESANCCCEGNYVLALGRLSKEKAIDVLISAFSKISSQHPGLKLFVVGEGPERKELERFVENLECRDRISFVGYVKDPDKYIRNARLIAMPSLQEGLPISLLEAMRAGIDIIASRVGQIPNVIDDAVSGVLVEPGSEKSLIMALELVLSKERHQFGERARESFVSRYTSKIMNRNYDSWYRFLGSDL